VLISANARNNQNSDAENPRVWQCETMRAPINSASALLLTACATAAEAPATTPVVATAPAPTDPTTTTTVASTTTVPVTTTTLDPATEILLRTYEWQEVSESVRELQNLIGRTPDAVSGPRTRESHLEALRAAGLPEDGVPNPDDTGDSAGEQSTPAVTAAPETTAAPVVETAYQPNCRVEFLANSSQASDPSFHINLTADDNGTQPPPHTDAIWPAAFDYIVFNLNMAEAGAGPSAGVSVVGEVWTSDDAFANGKVVTVNRPYDAVPGEEVRFSISVTFWGGGECDAAGTLTVP
jgi:hypothetical protein